MSKSNITLDPSEVKNSIDSQINSGHYSEAFDNFLGVAPELNDGDNENLWKRFFQEPSRKSQPPPFLLVCREMIQEVKKVIEEKKDPIPIIRKNRKKLLELLEKFGVQDKCGHPILLHDEEFFSSYIDTCLIPGGMNPVSIPPSNWAASTLFCTDAVLLLLTIPNLHPEKQRLFVRNIMHAVENSAGLLFKPDQINRIEESLVSDINKRIDTFGKTGWMDIRESNKNILNQTLDECRKTAFPTSALSDEKITRVESAMARIRHLILWLLGYLEDDKISQQSVTIPFYRSGNGGLSQLTLKLFQEGTGGIFEDPIYNGFCVYDDRFKECVKTSVRFIKLRENLEKNLVGKDVSWVIRDKKDDSPISSLADNSWGAGFALGLKHLLLGKNINPDCCITGQIRDNGTIGWVGEIKEKFQAVIQEAKYRDLQAFIIPRENFIAKDEQEVVDYILQKKLHTEDCKLREVKWVSTIDQASEIATRLMSRVIDYLDKVEENLSLLPKYYPDGYQFDRIRINIRVCEKRIRNEELAMRLESERRSGRIEYDFEKEDDKKFSPRSPYKHLSSEEMLGRGKKEERPKVEIFEWDDKAGDRGKNRRLVILGDPGFGKTFLLKYEGLRLAREARKMLKEEDRGLKDIILPIFIRLHDLVEKMKSGNGTGVAEAIVDCTVHKYLREEKQEFRDEFKKFLYHKMSTDKCALLLDALDEVPDKGISLLKEHLPSFSESGEYRKCRILLTSRIVDYDRYMNKCPVNGAREVELIAFNPRQIQDFVDAWFGVNWIEIDREDDVDNEGWAEDNQTEEKSSEARVAIKTAREIINDFRRKPTVMAMCRIPLLLSLVCKLKQEGTLGAVNNRAQVYHGALQGLLMDWRRAKTRKAKNKDEEEQNKDQGIDSEIAEAFALHSKVEHNLEILEYIGWEMFQDELEQCSPRQLQKYIVDFIEKEKTEILQRRIKNALSGLSDEIPPEIMGQIKKAIEKDDEDEDEDEDVSKKEKLHKKASRRLADLENDGIFIKMGQSEDSDYMFLHRTFHEYLVASFIARHEMLPVKIRE